MVWIKRSVRVGGILNLDRIDEIKIVKSSECSGYLVAAYRFEDCSSGFVLFGPNEYDDCEDYLEDIWKELIE